jgi:hypothetical protein
MAPSDGHAATAATVTNRGWLRMLGHEGGSKVILTGEDVESASDRVLYDLGSTTLVTTPAVLADLAVTDEPELLVGRQGAVVGDAGGTELASSGYPSTVPPPRSAMRSSAPASAAVATP